MADQYALCLDAYKTQLRTLAGTYFPAVEGKAAGWQVTENDTEVYNGGDYFIVLKPGAFSNARQGLNTVNEWHVTSVLYSRFGEYANAWTQFRAFRSDILALPDTAPLTAHGINQQNFAALEQAGYLIDDQGRYTNFVVQSLDCTIRQRVLAVRAF
jgi:hypothetical protein